MKKNGVVVLSLLVGLATSATGAAGADRVAEWNERAGTAAIAACISPGGPPPGEARLYAMMHLAIHDTLNAIDRRSRPYAFDGQAKKGASVDAAVAAAARDVLVAVLNQMPLPPGCREPAVASVEDDYTAVLDTIPDGRAKSRGVALGQAAAAAIVALRAGDGSDTPVQDFSYQEGTAPGEYRFTPPFTFALLPGWGNVTPFVLRDSAQFRPGPPDAVTSQRYAADFNEVKRLGGDGVTTPSARTAEQTQIALFWVESSPLQWNRIARTVSAAQGLDSWENARLFGLLNLALADGYIGSFATKYHYNYWRPVTAIRAAHTDGNPHTSADPNWTPLRTTPPIPDYDSGHSVQGGAGAEVLKQFFGTDRVGFSTCSLTLPAGQTCSDASPVLRSYRSFSQAADENGLSRILVGFHFRLAVVEGIKEGRSIGNRAAKLFLQPADDHDD
jgi:hypothetical protein